MPIFFKSKVVDFLRLDVKKAPCGGFFNSDV